MEATNNCAIFGGIGWEMQEQSEPMEEQTQHDRLIIFIKGLENLFDEIFMVKRLTKSGKLIG